MVADGKVAWFQSPAQSAEEPTDRSRLRLIVTLLAHSHESADGERILEGRQVRGERDEHLRCRQRIAVGVVRSMDGEAERASEACEPGGGDRDPRGRAAAPPGRRRRACRAAFIDGSLSELARWPVAMVGA